MCIDLSTYNVTTIAIIVGATFWTPLIFCREEFPVVDEERITSTGGPPIVPTYRANNDELDDELPSYYEMGPPPAYKNKSESIVNDGSPSSNHVQ